MNRRTKDVTFITMWSILICLIITIGLSLTVKHVTRESRRYNEHNPKVNSALRGERCIALREDFFPAEAPNGWRDMEKRKDRSLMILKKMPEPCNR